MIVVSVIGIVLAFAVLIFAAYKKISMFLAAVLAAAIVALFGGLDVAASLVGADGPFLIGMKDFVGSWLVIFALGALLGALYDKSGATWRISSTLINRAGTQWTLLIYVLVGALLVYGGIQVTVMIFVLLPFAKILFPKAGIPWYLFPGITGLAIATFAMGQMPGSLQMQNIIPTRILGTELTAAPVEGVLATLFMIIVGVGYLYWQVKKGHDDPEAAIELYQVQGGILDETELEQRAPGFWISLLPMVVTFVLINGFGVDYRADQFEELLQYADHIVFNSPHQLAKFGPAAKAAGKSVGLRVNPEHSTQEGHEIYDPCAPGSRLGTTRAQWDAAAAQHPDLPDLLDGLHFHTLCEQDSDALAATLPALEAKFGDLLPRMKWLNFGGGHHITRPNYDLATLEKCITGTQEKYGVQVYLEPGEAWALNAGYLVTTVLDTLQNGQTHLAILDMSAACHTPDVIEMPYRPPLLDAGEPGEKPCTFRLGGPTCLAGDVVGDYSFAAPLTEGDRLIFGDMAIYSTCKNNTFNGMPLPDLWVLHENGTTQPLARFGYHDFKYRLGSPR